ncbi:MAG: sodium:calcium antiporter [Phycisphaeraceae bacterium]|nr:MAG: sodium:calcium antiporter [Phycisphaeraceae bacterium]
MLIQFSLLAAGIVVLIAGGDMLVRGAAAMAARLGVAPLIIGLTIVAFGTSAPELSLNVVAATSGATDLSFGNIVGSNIANIGLILGISALLRPMAVHSTLVNREIPIMLVASALLAGMMLLGPQVTGERAGPGLARSEGVALLIGFGAFMAIVLWTTMRRPAIDPTAVAAAEEAEEKAGGEKTRTLTWCLLMFFAGLALLLVGGKLAEMGAVGAALQLGLTETLIGLTVVAVATSLPELATSLIALKKGETDIAVGNIFGSNIFNLLLIMGVTATVAPVPLPAGGWMALAVMGLLTVALVPMCFTANRTISRIEGAGLLAAYAAYMAFEVWRAVG